MENLNIDQYLDKVDGNTLPANEWNNCLTAVQIKVNELVDNVNNQSDNLHVDSLYSNNVLVNQKITVEDDLSNVLSTVLNNKISVASDDSYTKKQCDITTESIDLKYETPRLKNYTVLGGAGVLFEQYYGEEHHSMLIGTDNIVIDDKYGVSGTYRIGTFTFEFEKGILVNVTSNTFQQE